MSNTQTEYLDKLLHSYEGYFDIHRPYELAGRELDAYCYFTNRTEKYALVKTAVLYAIDCFEHTLFFHCDRLTEQLWQEFVQFSKDAVPLLVKPNKEHMYSFVTMVVIAGDIDEDVKKTIKKTKYLKNFKMSLNGWCALRAVAVNMKEGDVIGNKEAKAIAKVCQSALV